MVATLRELVLLAMLIVTMMSGIFTGCQMLGGSGTPQRDAGLLRT